MNVYDSYTPPDPKDPPDYDPPIEVDIANMPNRVEAIHSLRIAYISMGKWQPDVEDEVVEAELDRLIQELADPPPLPPISDLDSLPPEVIKPKGHRYPKGHKRSGYTKNHGNKAIKSNRRMAKESRRRNR